MVGGPSRESVDPFGSQLVSGIAHGKSVPIMCCVVVADCESEAVIRIKFLRKGGKNQRTQPIWHLLNWEA